MNYEEALETILRLTNLSPKDLEIDYAEELKLLMNAVRDADNYCNDAYDLSLENEALKRENAWLKEQLIKKGGNIEWPEI